MWVARSVFGLGFWLVYDHVSHWKTLKGIHCTRAAVFWLCYTWGEISEGCCKGLQLLQNRATRIIPRRNTWKDTLCVLNWLSLACRRKLQKCILAFKCLNNLFSKYLIQFFTRNGAFHDHATRRSNELHPPKPKQRTFKYAGTICLEFPSLSNSISLVIKHLYLLFLSPGNL